MGGMAKAAASVARPAYGTRLVQCCAAVHSEGARAPGLLAPTSRSPLDLVRVSRHAKIPFPVATPTLRTAPKPMHRRYHAHKAVHEAASQA